MAMPRPVATRLSAEVMRDASCPRRGLKPALRHAAAVALWNAGPCWRDSLRRARQRGGRQASASWAKARARWLMACFSAESISPKVSVWPSGRNIGS
jgi:hypothetical protein